VNTDIFSIAAMQGFLILTFSHALLSLVKTWMTPRGASATVHRGEESMNSLYVLYGVATLVFSLTIDVADAFYGHKATIVLADYVLLTYLFFFSSWFRNSIVFRLLARIRKD